MLNVEQQEAASAASAILHLAGKLQFEPGFAKPANLNFGEEKPAGNHRPQDASSGTRELWLQHISSCAVPQYVSGSTTHDPFLGDAPTSCSALEPALED